MGARDRAVKTAMGRIRSRFIRALIESIQRETGGTALGRLRGGLSPHLRDLIAHNVLGPLAPEATLDLGAGMELMMACDRVLCGGSGSMTVRAMTSLASRVLSLSSGLVVAGDAVRTLQHLRAPFEQPFAEVELTYSARRSSEGFVLELSLSGQPHATRWLGWAGLGYARAASTFSGQVEPFRFSTEFDVNMARVLGRGSQASAPAPAMRPAAAAPPRRPSSQRRRAVTTNAAAEVDQILSRSPGQTPAHGVVDTRATPGGRGSGVRSAEAAIPPGERKTGR
jgi:hypothetical protein